MSKINSISHHAFTIFRTKGDSFRLFQSYNKGSPSTPNIVYALSDYLDPQNKKSEVSTKLKGWMSKGEFQEYFLDKFEKLMKPNDSNEARRIWKRLFGCEP